MENQEPKQYVSKPLKLNTVPRSENETVNILVQGADKTVKFIPRNEIEVNADWNAYWGPSQILNKPYFKTINGESITGYGNITVNGSGGISGTPNSITKFNISGTNLEESSIIEESDRILINKTVEIDSQTSGIMGLRLNKAPYQPNEEMYYFGNIVYGFTQKPAILSTANVGGVILGYSWNGTSRDILFSEYNIQNGTHSWNTPTGGQQGIPVLYKERIGLIFYKDSSIINKLTVIRTSSSTSATNFPDLTIPDGLFATHAFLGADGNVFFGATNSDYSINRIYRLASSNDAITQVIDLGASPVLGQPLIDNLFTSSARLIMFSEHEGKNQRITYAGVATPFTPPVLLGREFVDSGNVLILPKDETNTAIYSLPLTSGDPTPITLTGAPNANWRNLGISAIGWEGNSLFICPKTTTTSPNFGIHKFSNTYAFEGEIKQEYGNTLMFWKDQYYGYTGSLNRSNTTLTWHYLKFYPKSGKNYLVYDKDGNVSRSTEDISQYWIQRNDIMYLKQWQEFGNLDYFLAMDTGSKIYKIPATSYNRALTVQAATFSIPVTQNSMSMVFNTVTSCTATFESSTVSNYRGRRMTFINRMTGNLTISRTNAIDINGTVGSSAIVPPNRTGVLECIGNIFYFSLLAAS